jgi:ribosome-binding protein aMBF1 (putative translation factor)
MRGKKMSTNAVDIIKRRYVKDDAAREEELEEERLNAQVARLICDLRAKTGLSQEQLAKKIGTTQSVISRLEDADYEGHSLSMLNRIAKAFNQKITITVSPQFKGRKKRLDKQAI